MQGSHNRMSVVINKRGFELIRIQQLFTTFYYKEEIIQQYTSFQSKIDTFEFNWESNVPKPIYCIPIQKGKVRIKKKKKGRFCKPSSLIGFLLWDYMFLFL